MYSKKKDLQEHMEGNCSMLKAGAPRMSQPLGVRDRLLLENVIIRCTLCLARSLANIQTAIQEKKR